MRKDKLKLYLFEIVIVLILFIALFLSSRISRLLLSGIILIFTLIVRFSFKKKKIVNVVHKDVTYLMIALAIVYVGFFYLMGLFFYDFNKQMILFGFNTLINFIIPLTVIIISSEVMRFTLISQDGKIRIRNTSRDYSKTLAFIIMVLIDLIIYVGVYDVAKLDDFLALAGFIAFASISCNLYYNYYSKRFGMLGIIFYRLITILYVYIIPVIPDMYIYFRSFLRMLYPYLMFILMENTYGKTNFVSPYNTRRKNAILITFAIIFMAGLTMLISCQFRYGVLVVGSGSMTGTINKGDALIYKSYNNDRIKKGEVIVFNYNNVKIVHRVVEKVNVNGEIRYFTKGDINKEYDPGYRTKKDIIGIKKLKIKYVGIPTLWLHELFN